MLLCVQLRCRSYLPQGRSRMRLPLVQNTRLTIRHPQRRPTCFRPRRCSPFGIDEPRSSLKPPALWIRHGARSLARLIHGSPRYPRMAATTRCPRPGIEGQQMRKILILEGTFDQLSAKQKLSVDQLRVANPPTRPTRRPWRQPSARSSSGRLMVRGQATRTFG